MIVDDTTPEPIVDAPTEQPAPEPKAPKGPSKQDLAAQIAVLTETVAGLKADKDAAQAAAEAARLASLTDAERLAEDRKALDAERASLKTEARQAAAERLNILPKALALVPDVDPRTPEGAKALTDWARENPEFIRTAPKPTDQYTPPPKSALASVLSGETKHPYAEALKAIVGKFSN